MAFVAIVVGDLREGASASSITTVSWLALHLAFTVPFIVAASPSRSPRPADVDEPNVAVEPDAVDEPNVVIDRAPVPQPAPTASPALQPVHD